MVIFVWICFGFFIWQSIGAMVLASLEDGGEFGKWADTSPYLIVRAFARIIVVTAWPYVLWKSKQK